MSKCEHNRRSSRCVDCGGREICPHKRVQRNCLPCGGSIFCIHKIDKAYCKQCGGSRICEHNTQRRRCRLCSPKNYCVHDRWHYSCTKCKGKGVCEHNKPKSICVDCKGAGICEHNLQRRGCRVCDPLACAKRVLLCAKRTAKDRNHKAPKISPQEYLLLKEKSANCFACASPLDWTSSIRPHLHHSHETGEVFGFCHGICNQAEGMLSNMSLSERRNFLLKLFPEVFS